MSLVACSGCRRHVRSGNACPFCGAASVADTAPSAMRYPLRIAGALAVAASVGCSSSTTSTPVYGAPAPPDSATDSASTEVATDTAGPDDGGAAGTLYGAPAPDSGAP